MRRTMRRCEFYFHRRIRFTTLRQSEKAVLAEIYEISGRSFWWLNHKYGAILKPIQVWLPKSWFKVDYYNKPWVWEKGVIGVLNELIKKRRLMIGEAMEEKKHIERLH